MKFHIQVISFFKVIFHLFATIWEHFKILYSSSENTENAIWTSEIMFDEENSDTDTEFTVPEDEDILNPFNKCPENVILTSELLQNEEEEDTSLASHSFENEENTNIYNKDSKDAWWASELKVSEETENKISTFETEGQTNVCDMNKEEYRWASEPISNVEDEETESSVAASEDKEQLNILTMDSKGGLGKSETVLQEHGKAVSKMSSHEDGGDLSEIENNYRTSEMTLNIPHKGTESSLFVSEDKGKLNNMNNDAEKNCRPSEMTLNIPDKVADGIVFESKGYLNDLSNNLESNKSSEVMPNLEVEDTGSCWTSFIDEGNPNTVGVGDFMRNLFDNKMYTDVTFHFKGKKEVLSAHRLVLAAKCDFFEYLLFGNQKEELVGMQMHVDIKNVTFCIFKNILKYFYTDDIELTDIYTVLDIYEAAESFQIEKLLDLCKIYFESVELTENNVCSIFEVCNTKHIGCLKRRCISYIEKNTFHVISSTDFEKCTFSSVRQICKLKDINLPSEVELLEAILRWINIQQMSKQYKKEMTICLLKSVRFLSFSPIEFTDVMRRHPDLLTPKEGLKILIYLNNPTSDNLKSLPKWCNKNRRLFHASPNGVQRGIMKECSDRRQIKILLKTTSEQQNITELTAFLHMRCIKGMHQIRNIKFFFENVDNDGCMFADLTIKVQISPNGPSFLKKHLVKSKECAFSFKRGVTVFPGQTVQMEVTAMVRQCKFLQFDRWYNDPKLDFQCFFISKPDTGKLYFISEIEYGPLPPRLSETHGDGSKSTENKEINKDEQPNAHDI